MRRGTDWDLGIDMCTLLYLKQITNKDLLYSIGNYTQYLVITYNEKECKKIYMHVKSGLSAVKESACNAGDPGSIPG